ncbi:MAG: hypothetical protein NDI90_10430 [Nitrospira sp. BO4]|jgi:hypothetical protein|nr:hypothetical protein [Nitrospira sp. BO4]
MLMKKVKQETGIGLDNRQIRTAYWAESNEDQVQDINCCVPNCLAKPYAPAGTRSVCKDHFLNFLTWRRRRGPQMFHTYAGMAMEERDTIATEWMKTIRMDEVPVAAPKL